MVKIQVLSKSMASIFDPSENWACISIVTKEGDWPDFVKSQPSHLLKMRFADLDMTHQELQEHYKGQTTESYGTPFFSQNMAKQILDFYLEVREKVDTLLVHCEAGWSRSPGVAGALSKIFLGDDMYFFNNYSPNRFVYRLIINEALDMELLKT